MTAWNDEVRRERLAALARPSGAFAMVATDQRESLRAMFAELGLPDDRATRVAFKVAVARELSPYASALLVDAGEGLEPILATGALAAGCGLIVAADDLVQPIGGAVDDTRLDRSVDLAAARRAGAAAAKLLVIWRPDRPADARRALITEFIEAAHAAGLAAIVEVVARPPAGVAEQDWTEREEAVVEAAAETGRLRPDLYKAQVPLYGRGTIEDISRRSRSITAAVGLPWVVLSAGVAIGDFEAAVEAAVDGGASGFLAGRAIWRDAITAAPALALRERSVPRLRRLAGVVDRLVGRQP